MSKLTAIYRKNYYYKNHEREKAARNLSRSKRKDKAFALLGDKCSRCNFRDKRALQIDHINRATVPHGSYLRSGVAVYRKIIKIGGGGGIFQLLCANCNWIKRFEMNEHNKWKKAS